MTIATTKKQLQKAKSQMTRKISPLNKRLKQNNMCIWFDAEDELFFINRHDSDSKSGISFYLDQRKLNKIMALSDEALVKAIHDYYQ